MTPLRWWILARIELDHFATIARLHRDYWLCRYRARRLSDDELDLFMARLRAARRLNPDIGFDRVFWILDHIREMRRTGR